MTPTRTLVLVLSLAAGAARAQFCPLGETERRIVLCRPAATMDQCLALAKTAGCNVIRQLPLIHAVVIEVPSVRAEAADARLTKSPDVERVEKDDKVHWLDNIPSNDFAPPATGGLLNGIDRLRTLPQAPAASADDPEVPWGVSRVGAPQAWGRSQGEGATVGVIDTGIDAGNSDLAGQVAGGVSIVDAAHPGNWADDQGHGTHVSGTIAAKRDGQGVVGVAPKAKLYAIKVLDKDGNGNYDDVIAGIQWAMDKGLKLVNMSLGADSGSDALHAAVQAAVNSGVTIIAASGNSGGAVGYPGAYPEVIAVAASDIKDNVASFSSRGPEVSFIAPGVNILSTKMGGGTRTMSGTSMASPHVAGLAALAFARGARTPAAIRAALRKAAHPIPGATPDQEGSGMVLAGDLMGDFGGEGRPVLASLP